VIHISRQTLCPLPFLFFPRFRFLFLAFSLLLVCYVYIGVWEHRLLRWNLKGGESAERNSRRPRTAFAFPLGAPCFLKHLSHTNFHYTVFRRFDNHDSHVFVSLKWRLVLLWLLPGHTAVHAFVPAAQLPVTSTADAATSSVAQAGLDRLSFIIIISSLTIPSPWTLLRSLR